MKPHQSATGRRTDLIYPICRRLGRTVLVGLALASTALLAEDIAWKPFSVDHREREDSPVDVSFLQGGPAGQEGFIQVKDGHLAKPDGTRFRIWGVNLTGWNRGSTNMPPKADAARWAQALARAGVNCVRFHFLDLPTRDPAQEAAREATRRQAESSGQRNSVRPSGLVDGTLNDTRHLSAEALDRLDFFIAELKKRGIYANLNLNVGRTYKPGDEVPDAELIGVAKGFTYFGKRLLELQREYARELLTHYNPYTKSEYRNEPAFATVEIVNENSIYEFWFRNWLRGELVPGGPKYQLDLTPFYSRQLDEMYQDWLAHHRTPAQLEQIRKVAGVKPGAPVPRLRRGDFSVASKEQFYAEAEFYGSVERDFFVGMRSYLKSELGVKSLVVGTADHTYWIPNLPLLQSSPVTDYVDAHVYWQHPAIWGARNTPMVDDPLHSTIIKLARSPFLNRAFTVSEVNEPNPNEYGAEMIPILAAYASFQDWDGIYFYTFELKVGDQWQNFVTDNFDITLDPVKMIQMKAGALLFTRADVRPARETFARSYSHDEVVESMRLPESERPYFTPGFPRSLPLIHESRIATLDGKPTTKFPEESAPPYISDTGQLHWNVFSDHRGLVTVDSPRTQALVGFVHDHASTTTRHIAAEIKNDFCAITLTSLTPESIQRSSKLLLTACARWQNTGTQWNDRHTLWAEWGTGPTLIEPVRGWLTLRELDGAVALKLIPLDGASQPAGPAIEGRRLEEGWEIPLGSAAATTQYMIEIVR